MRDALKGAKRYLVIDASAILDEKGRLVAVVETLRDTTSEQEAKAAFEAQTAVQTKAIDEQLDIACAALATGLTALAKGDLTLPDQKRPAPLRSIGCATASTMLWNSCRMSCGRPPRRRRLSVQQHRKAGREPRGDGRRADADHGDGEADRRGSGACA